MATVMTSHGTGAPPPLPSRNNNNNNNRPVQRSQTSVNAHVRPGAGHHQGRSRSTDAPPQIPPQNYHRGPYDVNKATPPLPSRGNTADNAPQPPPVRMQSFETKSFVKRHTARAYSDPSNQSYEAPPPVPPPLRTLPTRNHGNEHRINDVYDADDPYGNRHNTQPTSYSHQDQGIHSPPGRPPKSNSSSASDFERRFVFHDVKDFPDPEPIEHFKKTYPSLASSVRVKDHKDVSTPYSKQQMAQQPPCSRQNKVSRPKNQLGYL